MLGACLGLTTLVLARANEDSAWRLRAWVVMSSLALFGALDWWGYAFVTTIPSDYAGELPAHFVRAALLRGSVLTVAVAASTYALERGRAKGLKPALVSAGLSAAGMVLLGALMALSFTQWLWIGGR